MKKILCIIGFSIVAICGIFFYLQGKEKATYSIDSKLLDSKGESKINKIIVHKGKRELSVYQNDTLLKTYKIALGRNPVGHKQFEGDKKTPEGEYFIDSKNPNSKFYMNLGISYPNAKDRAYAASQGKSAGGDIKIHGLPNGFNGLRELFASYGDWTDGCIALFDADMYELYHAVPLKTKIIILP
ncbi:L,D-transpeptidase family protein [Helicobacter saguini]|uniref:L,D-transpeptidase family protein n=1 Tax=Helicobacter saguini TaxID=1548018 RepID=A0A347VMY9_9HELI|nr:L,D-transpeptidase family protein [Helicobacter saguini]MWV61971.1 L,D-transpeptidase family protein [Helicobacter saguini]MWV67354.1 L,D-transpeptidase family protein [Helicobacter saguini]MWV69707.1 L,D-transpeptidase family protein [Helicobacter saguini]MWV73076.1 L,D-transpeptidase family protein [Helicobacter saguini]TLD95553.1 hypothetical protein LS64_001455 [Helicobacter saguini]